MRSLFVVLTLIAASAMADNPETLTERSQARARAVVDSAARALGGEEALLAIETVRLHLRGQTWPRLQMPTAAPPFEAGSFDERMLFDLRNNRLTLEQKGSGAGFENHNRIVLKSGEGTNYDLRARTATPIPAAQATGQQFVQYYRRLPHLIVRQALDRANTLRHLGQEQFQGSLHDVITFTMPDAQQVALYVDSKSGLPSKYELIITDPLTGEDAAEIMFADYTSSGRYKVPQKWIWRISGDVQARYDVQAEFDPKVAADAFEVAESGFTRVPPAPNNLEQSVEKLGEGVYVIHNVAGQNQNTLAVAFDDYVLAVEAPGTSAGADAVIRRIRETIPGKPIRYIAMTHHHGDHIGGLRSFIAEGATVVTTPSNRGVVEVMAAAKQNDRLAAKPRKPELLFIENGKRVFTDGKQTVELIDIGPNPHAKEMVIAYLPKERMVFQGDLFFAPQDGTPPGPAQASTLSFARQLRERGLNVERIASVHGRTATIVEFRAATEGQASTTASR